MLCRTDLSFKQDFIGELARKLNPTSFAEVLKKTYFPDPSLSGRNFAETFSEAFKGAFVGCGAALANSEQVAKCFRAHISCRPLRALA
jgi:hypothetical protein